jgi:integrase
VLHGCCTANSKASFMSRSLRVRSGDRPTAEPLKVRFNKRLIESLALPTADRTYVYDDAQAGLAICLTSAGARTFYCCYRADGRFVRYRIGPFPAVTVEQARDRAKELIGEVVKGADPQRSKRDRRTEWTLEEVFNYHLEHFARLQKKTWQQDERMFNAYLSGWKSRRLSAIGTEDVQALHTKLGTENGKYQANRVVELVHKLFVTAASKLKWKGENPAVAVDQFREESRDRFVLPDELPRLLKAIDDHNEPSWRNYFKLLLITGVRRSNALAARWEQIDWQRAVWRLPDTKSGKPINVELVAQAIEVLEAQKAVAVDSPWVFPANRADSKTGHATQPDKAWKVILKSAGIENLRIHDLRRTLGSWQALGGASQTIIGASLGHAPGSTATAVYARLTQSIVRESVGRAVDAMLAAGKQEAK